MDKKHFYLLGLVLTALIFVGYHFYAASQAEHQIDRALQEQAKKNSLSVHYSSLDIAPFSAKMSLSDFTFIMGDHIERADHIEVDMGYLDFLNIYLGGVKYGLERLTDLSITVLHPTYVNRSGLQEIKADTLLVYFRGNALDAIQSAVGGKPFSTSQGLETHGSNVTLTLPETLLSKIRANQLHYTADVSTGKTEFWKEATHRLRMDSLTWSPSKNFQQKYRFFIKGFGYDTDAIPLSHALLSIEPANENSILNVESEVKSDLFLANSNGKIVLQNPLADSELQDMEFSVTDFSDTFSNVLNNLEKLFSITLPQSEGKITLQIEGTLANPRLSAFTPSADRSSATGED